MKKVFFGLIILLVCLTMTGIVVGDIPDMVGVWTGSAAAHHEDRGIIEGPD